MSTLRDERLILWAIWALSAAGIWIYADPGVAIASAFSFGVAIVMAHGMGFARGRQAARDESAAAADEKRRLSRDRRRTRLDSGTDSGSERPEGGSDRARIG